MPIDISPIIAGNAQLYYSDSEMFEPDLVRAFRKAVNANFTDTIVQAELTRSATGSTIWAAGGTAVGIDGTGAADTVITAAETSAVVSSPSPTTTQFSVTAGDGSKFAVGDQISISHLRSPSTRL